MVEHIYFSGRAILGAAGHAETLSPRYTSRDISSSTTQTQAPTIQVNVPGNELLC